MSFIISKSTSFNSSIIGEGSAISRIAPKHQGMPPLKKKNTRFLVGIKGFEPIQQQVLTGPVQTFERRNMNLEMENPKGVALNTEERSEKGKIINPTRLES